MPTPRLLMFWSIVPMRIPVAWWRSAEKVKHTDHYTISIPLAHRMLPLRDECTEHPCCFLADQNKPLLVVVKVGRFWHADVVSGLRPRRQRENSKLTLTKYKVYNDLFSASDRSFERKMREDARREYLPAETWLSASESQGQWRVTHRWTRPSLAPQDHTLQTPFATVNLSRKTTFRRHLLRSLGSESLQKPVECLENRK